MHRLSAIANGGGLANRTPSRQPPGNDAATEESHAAIRGAVDQVFRRIRFRAFLLGVAVGVAASAAAWAVIPNANAHADAQNKPFRSLPRAM